MFKVHESGGGEQLERTTRRLGRPPSRADRVFFLAWLVVMAGRLATWSKWSGRLLRPMGLGPGSEWDGPVGYLPVRNGMVRSSSSRFSYVGTVHRCRCDYAGHPMVLGFVADGVVTRKRRTPIGEDISLLAQRA